MSYSKKTGDGRDEVRTGNDELDFVLADLEKSDRDTDSSGVCILDEKGEKKVFKDLISFNVSSVDGAKERIKAIKDIEKIKKENDTLLTPEAVLNHILDS